MMAEDDDEEEDEEEELEVGKNEEWELEGAFEG
jgi:hypothetical protein